MTEIDLLFRQLIARTRVLATVCDNAATVLSAEFQDMITGPLAAVNDVLVRCPDVVEWNGSFNRDDIMVEVFRHEAQRVDLPPVSVRLRHVPSDTAVASYSKVTQEENYAVAYRALAEMVQTKWEAIAQQQIAKMGSGRQFSRLPPR